MQAKTKNTQIKVTTILLVVVAVALLAYYFKDKIKNIFTGDDAEKIDAPFTVSNDTQSSTTTKPTSKALPAENDLDYDLLLKRGSNNAETIALQTLLNLKLNKAGLNHLKLVVDGAFGKKTETALNQIYKVKSSTLGMLPIKEIYK